jgi:hypothetical protein
MGVGHIAVGFAAKYWAPRASLGWLVLAPVFVDLLWSVLILAGIEQARIVPGITEAMPLDLQYIGISHSLVGVVGWSCLLAAIYFALHKDARVAGILFVGVLSHFVLDGISHRPDMPLLPSGPHVGLGLWNHRNLAMLVEAGMLAVGVFVYTRTTRTRTRGNAVALGAVVATLFAINAGAYFGPPPPDVTPMAVMNLLLGGVLWILHRIDRGRDPRAKVRVGTS